MQLIDKLHAKNALQRNKLHAKVSSKIKDRKRHHAIYRQGSHTSFTSIKTCKTTLK